MPTIYGPILSMFFAEYSKKVKVRFCLPRVILDIQARNEYIIRKSVPKNSLFVNGEFPPQCSTLNEKRETQYADNLFKASPSRIPFKTIDSTVASSFS